MSLLALALAACGTSHSASSSPSDAASGDSGIPIDAGAAVPDAGAAGIPQEMVFMIPEVDAGGAVAPGPTTVYEIAVANLDGSNLKQLTSDGKFKFLPHFSPDGTRLVYTKYSVGGYGAPSSHADIAVFDLATGTEKLVTTTGANVQGTWSPDGTRIAYLAFVGMVGGGPGAIWMVDADGSNAHEVAAATGAPDDTEWGDIAWSRQDWLLFTVGQTTGGCGKVRTDKILPDGGSRTQVTSGGSNCTPPGFEQSGDADPGWSHDGTIIYSSRGFPARSGIYVADASGSTRTFVTEGFGPDWNPLVK